MGQLIKLDFLSLTVIVLLSCADQDNFTRKRVPVLITEAAIPETGMLNQNIDIYLSAVAFNSCSPDLEIELVKVDNRHFLFKATGMYVSNGLCLEVIGGKDTTLTFTPVLTGDYFFQINEDPLEIKRDTLHIY